MNSVLPVPASNNKNVNQSELPLASLNDTEIRTLLAILTTNNDKEAIDKSGIRKTRFYEIKKEIQPHIEKLTYQILEKAVQLLQANSVRAAEVLVELLDTSNPQLRKQVAETIIDRAVGKPRIVEQMKHTSNIMNFHIVGVSQEKIDALFIPKEKTNNLNAMTSEKM